MKTQNVSEKNEHYSNSLKIQPKNLKTKKKKRAWVEEPFVFIFTFPSFEQSNNFNFQYTHMYNELALQKLLTNQAIV